jgi:DNA-binding NarL/FixJ family response regulator
MDSQELSPIHVRLTPYQWRLCGYLTQGMKNKQIARILGVSEQVVKNRFHEILRITGCRDRLELALRLLMPPAHMTFGRAGAANRELRA